MSVEMSAEYVGDLHCIVAHGPSKSTIETDAPLDNAGRGQSFSPTDLLGAALLSCVLTTMAIAAKKEGIAFARASGRVGKDMQAAPRRIQKLTLEITLPDSLSAAERTRLREVGERCPVALSLSPEVQIEMTFT